MIPRLSIGARALWSIGRVGEPADVYPVRITSEPFQVGNAIQVFVIALRTNQAGEQYTSERPVNIRFLEPRSEMVEQLDGSALKPLTVAELTAQHKASTAAFQAQRAAALSVDALSADVAGAMVD